MVQTKRQKKHDHLLCLMLQVKLNKRRQAQKTKKISFIIRKIKKYVTFGY